LTHDTWRYRLSLRWIALLAARQSPARMTIEACKKIPRANRRYRSARKFGPSWLESGLPTNILKLGMSGI
jgi:hypothetical protein